MTLKLQIPAAVAEKLLRRAQGMGVPVETIVLDALEIVEGPIKPHPVTRERMRRALDDLAKFLPQDLPSIPMEALRRENIYAHSNGRDFLRYTEISVIDPSTVK